jgi:hypothetical protein
MKNARVEGLETATNPSISRNQLFTTSLQDTRCSCQPSRDGRRLDESADSRRIQQAAAAERCMRNSSRSARRSTRGKSLY